MKLFWCILLLFGNSSFASDQAKAHFLDEILEFGKDPGNLRMFVHQPKTILKSSKKVALVVALHGCSQDAKTIAIQSGWNKLADQYNFIVVYPQQKLWNNTSNCFNWFKSKDFEPERGESESIKSMIDYALKNYRIDPERVFVYGLSAGAAMGVALMANYPNTIESGAIFAGGPYKSAKNALAALAVMLVPPNKTQAEWANKIPGFSNPDNHYPRMIIVHGIEDPVVDVKSSRELVDQWTYLHHTDAVPDHTVHSFASNPLVERNSYENSEEKEVVVFYKIADTGHVLPVDPGEGETQGGATGMFAVDKDFYSTYYVAKDFGLIE